MLSRLTALVGGGSSLPWETHEVLGGGLGAWQHHRGTWRADGAPVSVWRLAATSKSDARLDAGRHGVKRLRTTRHPAVLAFRDSVEVEERGETVLYMVTEPVAPLGGVLAGMEGDDRVQYLCMGLSSVVAALSFLANDAALIHGGVCMAAIAVTPTLDWKLGAFDLVTEHQGCGAGGLPPPLAAASWLVPPQYQAGEVGKGDWAAVRGGPAWAVDAWGLGCLMQEVYSGVPLARTENLRHTGAHARSSPASRSLAGWLTLPPAAAAAAAADAA